VSEDIDAFCQIMERCPPTLELNGDLSHYLYRGIKQGPGLARVLSRVGHMHQRMARVHGRYRTSASAPYAGTVGGHVVHLSYVSRSPNGRYHIAGDLSADVENPAEDWDAKGITYQAFEYAKPALAGGLSSRLIMGESGPLHLVQDALSLDAKLVPLWRAMAQYADEQV
jgi:hypothetical protein